MAIAVLSAGLAGAAVVHVALRHAGRGLILMAFVTFCVAMLLAPFANGDPGAHPDMLPYVLLPGALAYVLLVTPVTAARIVAGACLWAVAFRAIAPHIVSEDELAQIRSDEKARQRDKGRLIKLAVLAPIWFAVGWLMLQIRLGP